VSVAPTRHGALTLRVKGHRPKHLALAARRHGRIFLSLSAVNGRAKLHSNVPLPASRDGSATRTLSWRAASSG
jgi:hypothetical protein